MSATELELAGPDWESFKDEMKASAPTEFDNDESKIDWLLGKIRKLHALIADNEQIARDGIRLQEDWLAGENAKLERNAAHFRRWIATLMPPTAEEAKKVYGKFSRSLPNGDIGWKKDKDTIVIEDADAVLVYAKANDLTIGKTTTTTFSVSKDTLKAHIEDTGVVEGDGWRQVEGLSHVFVKPAK